MISTVAAPIKRLLEHLTRARLYAPLEVQESGMVKVDTSNHPASRKVKYMTLCFLPILACIHWKLENTAKSGVLCIETVGCVYFRDGFRFGEKCGLNEKQR